MRQEAERLKIALGKEIAPMVILPELEDERGDLVSASIIFDRADFRALVAGLMKRVEFCINSSLVAADVSADQISYVVLAGSGSKIFTLEELVAKKFGASSIFTEFRDQAVVRGLAFYSRVLSGHRKDVLLLDNTAWSIAIKCQRVERINIPHEESTAEVPCALISGSLRDNGELFEMIEVGTIIPTLKGAAVQFENLIGDRMQIEFYTRSAWSVDSYSFGSILVQGCSVAEIFKIALDIDTNGVVIAVVDTAMPSDQVTYFQINRKFTLPIGYKHLESEAATRFESETFQILEKSS